MNYAIAIVSNVGALEIVESGFTSEQAAWERIEELPTNTLDKSPYVDERYHVFAGE